MMTNITSYRFLILFFLFCTNTLDAQVYEKGKEKYRLVAVKANQTEIESVSNTVEVIKSTTTYLPNAFSPDGDGVNDDFGFVGENIKNYHLKIFNRWGELIFSTKNLSVKWDGLYQGKPVPEGVFVYTLSGNELYSNENINQTGTITLLN